MALLAELWRGGQGEQIAARPSLPEAAAPADTIDPLPPEGLIRALEQEEDRAFGGEEETPSFLGGLGASVWSALQRAAGFMGGSSSSNHEDDLVADLPGVVSEGRSFLRRHSKKKRYTKYKVLFPVAPLPSLRRPLTSASAHDAIFSPPPQGNHNHWRAVSQQIKQQQQQRQLQQQARLRRLRKQQQLQRLNLNLLRSNSLVPDDHFGQLDLSEIENEDTEAYERMLAELRERDYKDMLRKEEQEEEAKLEKEVEEDEDEEEDMQTSESNDEVRIEQILGLCNQENQVG